VRRTIVLAGLAATIAAVPAGAQDLAAFRPADSYPELGQVLPTARAAWPGSPCAGREEIAITDTLPPGASEGSLGAAATFGGRCLVVLKPVLLQPGWGYELCVAVTHEFGHLAGFRHSDDPADLMYPLLDDVRYEPCRPATKPPDPPVPPGIVSITPDQELLIVQGGEHRADQILAGRYRHYRGEATCEYAPPPVGERSPTLTCTAAWRTKKRRYRATVLLREGTENVTLKTRRIDARHHRGGRDRDRPSRRGDRS
jgi:hypothetical protein